MRKIQRWSMTSIFDEYRKFAGTKVLADQEVKKKELFFSCKRNITYFFKKKFIETFNHDQVPYDYEHRPGWL